MPHPTLRGAALAAAAATLLACQRSDGPAGVQFRTVEIPVSECAFGQTFTNASTNPYFPIGPQGRQWVYEGKEGGTAVGLTITVLGTQGIGQGNDRVTTRVIEEHETEDGVTIEISRNFFAENSDGTVCYFGEDVDIFHYDESGNVIEFLSDSRGTVTAFVIQTVEDVTRAVRVR